MGVEVFLSLDLTSLNEALRIARLAVDAGFREIEAGTPLIKSVGMRAVRSLRDEFPSCKLFADMKTMDTGALEAGMAFESGADIMSVMAAAPDETIKEAVRKAESEGREVLVDTLGLRDVLSRLREVIGMGVHRICIHRGVDEGVFRDYDLLDRIRDLDVKLGVAGGIDACTIGEIVKKVDFVMVGRAVTKSDDPRRAASEVLRRAGIV
ncbi:MAG TPA: hypothetical protein ENF57_03725 [Candidatus Korarchaeota archaeon]|nr:hypothetical protein [Candidatus Korarchaeota archaeon]